MTNRFVLSYSRCCREKRVDPSTVVVTKATEAHTNERSFKLSGLSLPREQVSVFFFVCFISTSFFININEKKERTVVSAKRFYCTPSDVSSGRYCHNCLSPWSTFFFFQDCCNRQRALPRCVLQIARTRRPPAWGRRCHHV